MTPPPLEFLRDKNTGFITTIIHTKLENGLILPGNGWSAVLDIDDDAYHFWRERIGRALAEVLGMDPSCNMSLNKLPSGFSLYRDHSPNKPKQSGESYFQSSFVVGPSNRMFSNPLAFAQYIVAKLHEKHVDVSAEALASYTVDVDGPPVDVMSAGMSVGMKRRSSDSGSVASSKQPRRRSNKVTLRVESGDSESVAPPAGAPPEENGRSDERDELDELDEDSTVEKASDPRIKLVNRRRAGNATARQKLSVTLSEPTKVVISPTPTKRGPPRKIDRVYPAPTLLSPQVTGQSSPGPGSPAFAPSPPAAPPRPSRFSSSFIETPVKDPFAPTGKEKNKFFSDMSFSGKDSKHLIQDALDNDIKNPQLCRVSELVWWCLPSGMQVEAFDPGRDEAKDATKAEPIYITHWPAIVYERFREENKTSYALDVLGVSDNVRVDAALVVPWLGLSMTQDDPIFNTRYLKGRVFPREVFVKEKEPRPSLREVIGGGLNSFLSAFIYAFEIATYYSCIETRSIPILTAGLHMKPKNLIRDDETGAKCTLKDMTLTPHDDYYLSYDWIGVGPEIIWVGDILRLSPDVNLPDDVAARLAEIPKNDRYLDTCLVMHVTEIYRCGDVSPLMIRGHIFEMVPDESIHTPAFGRRARAVYAYQVQTQDAPVTAAAASSKPPSSLSVSLSTSDGEVKDPDSLEDLVPYSEDDGEKKAREGAGSAPSSEPPRSKGSTKSQSPCQSPTPKINPSRLYDRSIENDEINLFMARYEPFPYFKWRCISQDCNAGLPFGHVSILANDIAGRYYPLSRASFDPNAFVSAVEWSSVFGYRGWVGLDLLRYFLAGLVNDKWTLTLPETNGLFGQRNFQMLASELEARNSLTNRVVLEPKQK